MTAEQIFHSAFLKHGFLDPLPINEDSTAGERETQRTLGRMLREGLIARRERTVNIKPQQYGGNWPEMQPVGNVTIVTWHLTEAGRQAWLSPGAR